MYLLLLFACNNFVLLH